MKTHTFFRTAIAALALSVSSFATAQTPAESRQELFDERAQATLSNNVDVLLDSFHSDLQVKVSGMKQIMQATLNSVEFDSYELRIEETIHEGDPALVRVIEDASGTRDGKPFDREKEFVYILKNENGEPRVLQSMRLIDEDLIDQSTDSFVSNKGGFALQIPQGWIATTPPDPIGNVVTDGINAMAPDLAGSILVGVVQIPMSLPEGQGARMIAQTDAASMKALSKNYRQTAEKSVTLEGMAGWEIMSEFEIFGQKFKRSQLYFENDSLIYFIILDMEATLTEAKAATIEQTLISAYQSFRLVSTDDNLTVAEQLRTDLGQGQITGNIYSNDEFNCYIAAPEDWTLRTSSTPSTLVEMQYNNGSSIIRILAEDNLPSTITAEQASKGRLSTLPNVVQNYNEKYVKPVQLAGETAWMSEQSYTLEGLGHFDVKEVTFVRDGKYYLVLCQAIAPDDFTKLVKDFDAVINSFGFTN